MMIAEVLAHSLPELKTQLSGEATISYPEDVGFNSMRWSDFRKPNPGVIINVANEDDICSTVCFPSLPLLVYISNCVKTKNSDGNRSNGPTRTTFPSSLNLVATDSMLPSQNSQNPGS